MQGWGAIPVRESPGDQWCHIEVPGGVSSVSTVPVAFSEHVFKSKKCLFLAPWKISGMINI